MALRLSGQLDVPRHQFLRLVEQCVADYRLVLSLEYLARALDFDLPCVDAVLEDHKHHSGTPFLSVRTHVVRCVEFSRDLHGRRGCHISLENHLHRFCRIRVNLEPLVFQGVSVRRGAARPHSALLGCVDLVADAVGGHLPLELREGHEDVEHHAPRRVGRVYLLRDGYE